ncbi:MAG TPA: DUF1161 domain-containing protein [Variovorax sp.]|nr:DUF1161 domain-containing protein [Variovorax sp.]
MFRSFLFAAALLLASSASQAADTNNCDAIRAQIDAKVRASGVSDFALSVVAADAQANGRVVGSCDLGSRKIVYDRVSSPGVAPAQSKANPRRERILTECKDGSVSMGGDCKS